MSLPQLPQKTIFHFKEHLLSTFKLQTNEKQSDNQDIMFILIKKRPTKSKICN